MLQFIKGQGTALYFELIEKNSSYKEALYLDTVAKRLYFDGAATDVRVSVNTEIDEDYIAKLSYQFTNTAGETTIIKDTVIPELNDYVMTLHNIESGEDNDYSNGLYPVKDKYLLEAMTKLIGITIEYTYYANVNHYSDMKNNDTDTKRDVVVYYTEDGKWVYDYDAFQYAVYNKSGVLINTLTEPAGSMEVDEDLVRVQSIKVISKGGIQPKYDGGELDNNKKTITAHGGIPAGTSVADLEKKTVSEVLSDILFLTATPVKVCDTSVHIKYVSEYVQNGFIEVGATYPGVEDLEVTFTPETWKNVLGDTTVGDLQYITEVEKINYYIKDDQHPWIGGHGPAPGNIYDMEESVYAEHHNEYKIAENDKSSYYAVVKYKVAKYPLDTNDSSTFINEDGEVETYRSDEEALKVGDSSTMKSNSLYMTEFATEESIINYNIISGWKIASNANIITDENIWDKKNVEPEGDFIGTDEIVISDYFAYNGTTLYAKWTSEVSINDCFYIYLPVGYTISEIGTAHDAIENSYSAVCSATMVTNNGVPVVEVITNNLEVDKNYNKFEIQKSFGITTVRFTVAKVQE